MMSLSERGDCKIGVPNSISGGRARGSSLEGGVETGALSASFSLIGTLGVSLEVGLGLG